MQFNSDMLGEVMRAHMSGASAEEMKAIYIRRNTLGISPDTPIYRIMELQYLCEDVRERCFSHVKIDASNWDDPTENPLLSRVYHDNDGSAITLDGVVDRFYGSCWSATKMDGIEEWAKFSRGRRSVRIESTPGRLLHAVMSLDNPFHMLHHFIGKVRYAGYDETEEYFSDANWEKHLDSLGQGIASSFLQLDESLSYEDEVRLLYDHAADPWPQQSVRICGHIAKVPFDWTAAIVRLDLSPFCPNGAEAELQVELRSIGLSCPMSHSTAKTT